MEYGTGAVFGVPAHDQRDFDFAQQIRPADPPRRLRRRQDRRPISPSAEAYTGPGTLVNSHFLDGMDVDDAKRAVIGRAEAGGWGEGQDGVAAARLGRDPPALLGHADPDHPLRRLRRGAGAARPAAGRAARGCQLRHARQPARPPSDLEACRLPELRRRGAARDRHARHVRRFVLVFHPLRQPARGQAVRPRGGRALAAGRAIYRRRRACDPAPALCAVLDARAEAYRHDRRGRAVRRPVHARHGDARDLS